MRWQNIVGHEKVKQLLRGSTESGHISHAYIFEGPSGVGRMTTAKAFAEEIVGAGGSFNAENHPDIIVVTNELYNSSKKQANVLVDTIRSMKADVYIKPYMSDRKVYIIPNADSMASPAQNSLLQVFEEPPEYCTIILIAQNSNSLLPTILSRASLIRFLPLETKKIEKYLKEKKGIEDSLAKSISAMSGGSIGEAIALLEDSEASALRAEVIDHLIKMYDSGHRPLYDFIKFLKQKKASIKLILNIMEGWSSDVVRLKFGLAEGETILNADKETELKEACSRITRGAAFRFEEIVAKYSLEIARNTNYPIAVQCMAMEYWEEIHGRNYRSAF